MKKQSSFKDKIIGRVEFLVQFSLVKTLYFNFRYFPFSVAIKLPVSISKETRLKRCKGEVVLKAIPRTDMIRIGFEDVPIIDRKFNRTIWQVEGKIVFEGTFYCLHSCCINVNPNALCTFGNRVKINVNTKIICSKFIRIGNHSRFGWNCQIIDSDFHDIEDEHGRVINTDLPIEIGDYVWIGANCIVKKGVTIESWNIIGSNSCVTKDILGQKQIAVGSPARVVKKNVVRSEFLALDKKKNYG